ncbi:hypothetical protein KY289_028397 [Solanum tuberosum]|nr:hypothetical protein KY289_028397 [Solanum tuberosum]
MLFISFAFLSSAFLAKSGEVDDESEFSYVENAENGPANWSNIHPNWIKCKSGKLQSPIDFPNNKVEIVSNLGILQKFYKPSNATLLNRGHDIMLRWDDGGFLKINGTQYRLKQVHWHTPSEHTIDGKRYMGSLTVPPCTENVIWTIDGKVKTVTRKQIQLLRDVVHDGFEYNARPIQPLNGRPIKFNKPWSFA